MKIRKNALIIALGYALSLNFALVREAIACSRVVHTSKNGQFVATGRSMDWFEDVQTNLWLFPRGMQRDGSAGRNSLRWVSKYGSVVAAGFDAGTADGLNEKGLMANLLYLAETDFGKRNESRPGISWSIFTQYLLDNFATVAEAVEAIEKSDLQVVASPLPGSVSKPPSIHFAISDATGDSAIFEYINGKLVIHHGKKYPVMTNSPPYDQQIALNAYWQSVGGDAMLPGTRRAADRFVRANYYLSQLPDPKSERQAIANVMSVMRNVSVPFGNVDPSAPNLSQTIWRTVGDNTNRVYYFESTLSPSLVWVRLDQLNFNPGAPVKKLSLVGNYNLAGDVTNQFVEAKPFVFTGPTAK
jgi:penicillin V acylase-like amidase (Ntn superfamily)